MVLRTLTPALPCQTAKSIKAGKCPPQSLISAETAIPLGG